MKIFLTTAFLFIATVVFAQSKQETEILNLSKQQFIWEIENKIDSIANLLDEKFMVVNSAGQIQNREKYLATLSAGNVVHNSIDIEEHTAAVQNNTGVVTGKGKFTVTVAGSKKILHLSFMQVYARNEKGWKLLALYASVLPN